MSLELVRESDSPSGTRALGAELARRLPGGSVLLLEGELGTGKTQFAKGLAEGLGLDPDEVVSPTFLLVQVHENLHGLGLVHADLYRLAGASELAELGLDELPGPNRIAAIEWPDRLEGRGSGGCWRIRFEETGDGGRRLLLVPPPLGSPPPGRIT